MRRHCGGVQVNFYRFYFMGVQLEIRDGWLRPFLKASPGLLQLREISYAVNAIEIGQSLEGDGES